MQSKQHLVSFRYLSGYFLKIMWKVFGKMP